MSYSQGAPLLNLVDEPYSQALRDNNSHMADSWDQKKLSPLASAAMFEKENPLFDDLLNYERPEVIPRPKKSKPAVQVAEQKNDALPEEQKEPKQPEQSDGRQTRHQGNPPPLNEKDKFWSDDSCSDQEESESHSRSSRENGPVDKELSEDTPGENSDVEHEYSVQKPKTLDTSKTPGAIKHKSEVTPGG